MSQPKKLTFKEKQEQKLKDECKNQMDELRSMFLELKKMENSEAVVDAAHVVRMQALKIVGANKTKSHKIHEYGIEIATYAQNIIQNNFSL